MKRRILSRTLWVGLALALLSALLTWKVAGAATPLPPPFDQVVSQIVNALQPSIDASSLASTT